MSESAGVSAGIAQHADAMLYEKLVTLREDVPAANFVVQN